MSNILQVLSCTWPFILKSLFVGHSQVGSDGSVKPNCVSAYPNLESTQGGTKLENQNYHTPFPRYDEKRWFNKKVTVSVHKFNDDYLSIPERLSS